MSEIKKILRAWAISSIIARWVIIGAVTAAGAYAVIGPGVSIQISINQEQQ